jgi:hypothetical protein
MVLNHRPAASIFEHHLWGLWNDASPYILRSQCVPVMIILKLKLVTLLMLDETESVSTAVTTWPAVSTDFSWFQVNLMLLEADEGLQLFVVMFNVADVSPVFFTYIV